MVEPERLIQPSDDFRRAFPELDFRDVYSLTTAGEQVLITDPTYLADVYNSTDKVASLLRQKGVFLMQFGGDVRCPVWWRPPYILLPTSNSMPDDEEVPEGAQVLAEDVHTDSGSFIFLPLTDDLSHEVKKSVEQLVHERNGAVIDLPAGKWVFYYEQFPAPAENVVGLYRNIVVRHFGRG
jgi:hypothetical protein